LWRTGRKASTTLSKQWAGSRASRGFLIGTLARDQHDVCPDLIAHRRPQIAVFGDDVLPTRDDLVQRRVPFDRLERSAAVPPGASQRCDHELFLICQVQAAVDLAKGETGGERWVSLDLHGAPVFDCASMEPMPGQSCAQTGGTDRGAQTGGEDGGRADSSDDRHARLPLTVARIAGRTT
jgi:hypothetical protein